MAQGVQDLRRAGPYDEVDEQRDAGIADEPEGERPGPGLA